VHPLTPPPAPPPPYSLADVVASDTLRAVRRTPTVTEKAGRTTVFTAAAALLFVQVSCSFGVTALDHVSPLTMLGAQSILVALSLLLFSNVGVKNHAPDQARDALASSVPLLSASLFFTALVALQPELSLLVTS